MVSHLNRMLYIYNDGALLIFVTCPLSHMHGYVFYVHSAPALRVGVCHCWNFHLPTGIVDSSGIEFFYTKQKPLFEAGGISIAIPIVPLMLIPPKNEFFRHSATCLPSCTNKV